MLVKIINYYQVLLVDDLSFVCYFMSYDYGSKIALQRRLVRSVSLMSYKKRG